MSNVKIVFQSRSMVVGGHWRVTSCDNDLIGAGGA